jgi:hypothetical protein
MSGAGRARAPAKRGRTLQERINELQARAAKEKKRKDLVETIAQARRELQGLKGKK